MRIQMAEKVVVKPSKRREKVIEFIVSAKESLLLSVFRCDDFGVLDALGEAAARGVNVEALMTGRAKGWGQRLAPLASCLERMGVKVRQFPRTVPKYHAKYMVADGRRALIGTLNLTAKCFRRTRDFMLVTDDAEVAQRLTAMFRADAAGMVGGREAACDRLIAGPEMARARVEELLRGARRSIRIMDHKLSDEGVLALLRERQRAGVSVEIQSGDGGGEYVPHGRLIVVDGRVAVFGSFSLTQKSLDMRRELAVMVTRPELVAKLEKQFSRPAERRAAAWMRAAA